jgi:hypothetical protein
MDRTRSLGLYKNRKKKGRWGKKKFKDNRNWPKYNEQLVVRGEFYLDFEFVTSWKKELEEMNRDKVGAPFLFPDSFMNWQAVWHQFMDYRGLEGIARSLSRLGLIPEYDDYTTAWKRIHGRRPEIILPEYDDLDVGSDGSGLKTNNAGEYRVFKYGERKGRRKCVVVIITADVRHHKLLEVDAHIEGEGEDEPPVARKHIRKLKRKGKKVKSFYGDGKFDTNDMFNELDKEDIEPKIPVHINASSSGSDPPRRKQVRIQFGLPTGRKIHNHYFKDTEKRRRKWQKRWRKTVGHGHRWPATEGIFSAVKRKFGENVVSRKKSNMIFEAIQRFWAYDTICNYALQKM